MSKIDYTMISGEKALMAGHCQNGTPGLSKDEISKPSPSGSNAELRQELHTLYRQKYGTQLEPHAAFHKAKQNLLAALESILISNRIIPSSGVTASAGRKTPGGTHQLFARIHNFSTVDRYYLGQFTFSKLPSSTLLDPSSIKKLIISNFKKQGVNFGAEEISVTVSNSQDGTKNINIIFVIPDCKRNVS